MIDWYVYLVVKYFLYSLFSVRKCWCVNVLKFDFFYRLNILNFDENDLKNFIWDIVMNLFNCIG